MNKTGIMKSSATFTMTLAVMLASLAICSEAAGSPASGVGAGLPAYIEQARKLFDPSSLIEPKQVGESKSLLGDDAQKAQMLRDSIIKATELINSYQSNGLANMPSLPNIPGMNTMMRTPDKILRAELSMLQDLIRMSAQMIQNPIGATINMPKDLASMLGRIAEQIEQ